MKKGIIITIALFLLMCACYNGFSKEELTSNINPLHFYNGIAEIENDANEDLNFYVSYLLDADGKPYIVSIKSKDEHMTEMVRKMINQPLDQYPNKDGKWYSITFIYDNIQ